MPIWDIEDILMEFTFNFYTSHPKPMAPLNISVENENCKSKHTSYMQEMDQGLKQQNLGKNTANGIPMRETGGREKSNKCNQCDSTFYRSFEDTFENPQTNATNVIMHPLRQAI